MQKKSPDLYGATKHERGSALVLAMLVMLIMSIVITGMATDSDLDLKISRNLELKNQAFNNAESGIAVAAEVVRQAEMLVWLGENNDVDEIEMGFSDDYSLKTNSYPDLNNEYCEDDPDPPDIEVFFEDDDEPIAEVWVKELGDNSDESKFKLRSIGYDFEENDAESTILVLFLPLKPFDDAGKVGCEEVEFTGQAYSADTDVLSGGEIINDVNVTGDVKEYNEIVCDPLGSENMLKSSVPDSIFSEGDIRNEDKILVSDDFYDDFYMVEDFVNSTLTVEENLGDVTLYVEGDLEIDDLIIKEDTQLTIFVEGNIDISGNSEVNRYMDTEEEKPGRPKNLIIYSDNSSEDGVTIGGNAKFRGALYAPLTDIKYHGTPDITGAVRGRTVIDNGNVNFEYDPFFEDWVEDFPGGYYLTNWNSLQE